MSTITTEIIKELRDETGVSIMQCKKALEDSGGDVEKAKVILAKQSRAAAEKKADRNLGDGLIITRQKGDQVAILVLRCETDFVAKNDDFIKVANDLTDMALEIGIEKTKEAAQGMLDPLVQKIGENMALGELSILEGSPMGIYNHNGKNVAVVVMMGGTADLARDIAMHITAMKPRFLSKDEINEVDMENAKAVFEESVADKPDDMKAKILEGKLNTYFKDFTLLEQNFVKNPDKTIEQLLKDNDAGIALYEHVMI
ncbi:translation elongation factor Ts [Candidatus Nomurabacteria bacterium RIFCSPHIGHO2_02_FULL_38_15]|uniref:Elongation factor Ts n=1 Tax=Candidatus Nomurabacteria bacterium RIFCSPHIGHO2_02_FULL_38_15 TaxID=1801752 RepID=A0A1F6VQC5_9BACT|nr:MAG: translation elongation factor Ts [Candidatus Nomurabacteria bacterium RIFCSPHIGHO2_02_FULL_38_15]